MSAEPGVLRITSRRPKPHLNKSADTLETGPNLRRGAEAASKPSSDPARGFFSRHWKWVIAALLLLLAVLALRYFEEKYDWDYDEFTKFYDLLGLPARPEVTLEEIKAAHHKLARVLHPDKCDTSECADRYVPVLKAYETLKAHHTAFWEKQRLLEDRLQSGSRRH